MPPDTSVLPLTILVASISVAAAAAGALVSVRATDCVRVCAWAADVSVKGTSCSFCSVIQRPLCKRHLRSLLTVTAWSHYCHRCFMALLRYIGII